MSMLIIDPITSLQGELDGKSIEEKESYLRQIFSLSSINKSFQMDGYWALLHGDENGNSNGKLAIFCLETDSLVKLPYQPHDSEFFGNITAMCIIPLYSEEDRTVAVCIGGDTQQEKLVDIDFLGVLHRDTLDIQYDIPDRSSLSSAVEITVTRERSRQLLLGEYGQDKSEIEDATQVGIYKRRLN